MLQLYIPVPSILGLIRRGIHDESEPGPPPDLSGQGGVTRYHFHRCLSTPIFPRMVGDLDRQEEQKQQEDHLEWISADVCRKRLLTTGTWILETESFRNWKNGLSEPILWINGITGAEKTISASGRTLHFRSSEAFGLSSRPHKIRSCCHDEALAKEPLNMQTAQELLRLFFASSPNLYVIIDGLDDVI